MSSREVADLVEPLVLHQAFPTAEEAVRELVSDYILRQIDLYRAQIAKLEAQYGTSYEQFGEYLKERSALLADGQLDPEHKKKVAQAVMQEEEDYLDGKIARDFLNGWLGLKAEAAS